MKWYTAVGIKVNHYDGKFHVRNHKYEEKVLCGMEIFLWTSLLWAFTEESGIYIRIKYLLDFTFPDGNRKEVDVEEFKYCLRRLCMRGLITACEGDTKEEAAAELMRKATVELTNASFHDRYISFLTSLVHGNGFRFSLKAFKKKPLEKSHRKLLERLKEQGEIVLYLEEIQAEGTEYGQNAFGVCERQKEFLHIIMELYKKKIITIRTVERGGAFEEEL